jgi:hypothetical protein
VAPALLVALEILLRLAVMLPLSSPSFVHDADIGYRMADGVAGTRGGFNTSLTPGEALPSGKRLLFVGDSFTYGTYPAARVFPERVADRLTGSGVPAIALSRGLPAAGPSNYLRVAEFFTEQLDPDVVVVTVYLGNDIEQSHPRQETRLFLGAVATVNQPHRFGLNREDYYVYLAARKARAVLLYRLAEKPAPLSPLVEEQGRTSAPFSPDQLFRAYRREIRNFESPSSRFIQEALGGLVARLIGLRGIVGDRTLLIVLAPSRVQVDAQFREELMRHWNLDPHDYCVTCIGDSVREDLSASDISVLDLTSSFMQVQKEHELYNQMDTHWNLAGNELSANLITDWVRHKHEESK